MIFESMTVDIVTSFIILVLGLVIGRIAVNIVRNLFKDIGLGKMLGSTVVKYVVTLVQYVVYIVTLFFIFRQLGFSLYIFQWVGLFVLGLILVLVFLSFKDTLPNLTAWLYVRRKFCKGQVLEYEGFKGKIICVGFFEVIIRSTKKEVLAIPNVRLVLKKV